MEVIKYSGGIEPFNPEKIKYTILDAGGSKKLAEEAVQKVTKEYHKGMTTKEILNILLKFLKKEPGVSERYDLKRAIMSLGPSGFPFETFFANLLNYYDYTTKVGEKLIGNGRVYEIDIIAEKNINSQRKKFMIECKYHNKLGIRTKIHHAKHTYQKFLKLQKYNFNQPWLTTNTKCSLDTLNYAKKVNLKITSWKYPKNESLKDLIKNKKLYPITILKFLPKEIKEKLYNSKILILKDLFKYNKTDLIRITGLTKKEIEMVTREARDILGNTSQSL